MDFLYESVERFGLGRTEVARCISHARIRGRRSSCARDSVEA